MVSDVSSLLEYLRESPGLKKMQEATELARRNGFEEEAVKGIIAGITQLAAHPNEEVVRFLQLVVESTVLTREMAVQIGIKL